MINVKNYIKNNLWQINWLIPFTTKYRFQGKKRYMKKICKLFFSMKVYCNPMKVEVSILNLMKNVDLQILSKGDFFYWIDTTKTIGTKGSVLSNFTLDYEKIISNGFHEITNEALNEESAYSKKVAVIREAIDILYRKSIETIKNANIDARRKSRMLSNMNGLLDGQAGSFQAGLQRILFFNQYLWQTRHRLNGIGRLDKILGGLYKNDLEKGLINEKEATTMLSDFFYTLHEWYEYKSAALLGDVGQIIVLGGVEKDGTYFCNELTFLLLKVHTECKLPDPKLLLRVSYSMPVTLLKEAVECLKSKTGNPIFSNDDIIIPKLIEFGFDKEDSYNYCVSACWEPYIVGKSLDQNNLSTFDFFQPLDKLLNKNTEYIHSYDELVGVYLEKLKEASIEFLQSIDSIQWAEDTFISLFTEECNTRKIDISKGGAKYNHYGITTVGIASVCNSLLHIKELVFDTKQYTLKELNAMRCDDYMGHEEVYEQIKALPKFFGHDDGEGIELTNKILKEFNKSICEKENRLKGKFKYGLSAPNYIISGNDTGGDFDGRFAKAAYSTHISCEDAIYTEIIRFSSKINYARNGINGNVVDFFIAPSLLEENSDKFLIFIKSSIKVGFYQMQMNIMDSKTLIDAKENPEKYPGLIVRVWGFSAYFNDLPEIYKDVLIKRAMMYENLSI